MNRRLLVKPKFWMAAVLAAGIGYLIALQILVPDGTYFSGDSGLKALVAQNLAGGSFRFDLNPPDPPWIRALWAEGMFPYHEPFVYRLAKRYFITFPYTFSLVTAPFFALLGYRGLYAIPWLATLGIWLVFYRLCRKLELGPAATAIGAFVLIFTSYLSLYSAIYWEHTLAVFLSFAGLSLVIPQKGAKKISFWAAAAAGILSGLAVWFRDEQILLVIFVDLAALWALAKARWRFRAFRLDPASITDYIGSRGWVFLAASTLALLAYGLTNWLIYQNVFGVHAIQVLEPQSLRDRLLVALQNVELLTVGSYSLFLYLPIALFPLGYLLFTWIRPRAANYEQGWSIWYLFCAAFVLGVALLVPAGAGGKQWGPRFLLFLVPVIVLLFTWQLDHLVKNLPGDKKFSRWAGLGCILVLAGVGIIQNPLRGGEFLAGTYAQVEPVVATLRAQSKPVLAVSDQYLGQVFQPALSRDILMLEVKDVVQLARLSEGMAAQNQDAFSYVCYSYDCGVRSLIEKNGRVEWGGNYYLLQVLGAWEYGKYTILNVQVRLSKAGTNG